MHRAFVEAQENLLSNLTTFFKQKKKKEKKKKQWLTRNSFKGSSKYYYKPNTSATFQQDVVIKQNTGIT